MESGHKGAGATQALSSSGCRTYLTYLAPNLCRYPGEVLPEGKPYFGMPVDDLLEHAHQAFREWNPIHNLQPVYKSYRCAITATAGHSW